MNRKQVGALMPVAAPADSAGLVAPGLVVPVDFAGSVAPVGLPKQMTHY